MGRTLRIVALPCLVLAIAGCKSTPDVDSHEEAARGAHLYTNMGTYTRTVSTSSPEAQAWFDQGIQLLYGFNHDEAIRSFESALRYDPDCAMAWWGVAYANGLHINNTEMSTEASRAAWLAAWEARRRFLRTSSRRCTRC